MLEVMYCVNEGNFYALLCCKMFQFGTASVSLPVGGQYLAVGMHSVGEEVRLFLGLNWISEENNLMSVDMNEEERYCVNDVRLNRQVCYQHYCR